MTSTGKHIRAKIWAQDVKSCNALLRQKGWHPVAIKTLRRPDSRELARLSLPAIELAAFLDQLSMQLDAEIPIDAALRNMMNEMEGGPCQQMTVGLLEGITKDGQIAKAFSLFPRIFPVHVCQMIEVGHQSGRLAETFSDVAKGTMEDEEVRSAAKKALQYPLVAGFVTVGVGVFLLGFVMPMFGRVFADLGVKLPPLTAFYLSMSTTLSSHRYLILAVGVLAIAGVKTAIRRKAIRDRIEVWMATMPVLGEAIQAVSIARITSSLKLLCGAGVSVQDGLGASALLTGNAYYNGQMGRVLASVRSGAGLGHAMDATGAFPCMMTLSLRMGEEANRLPQALEKMHLYYSRKAQQKIGYALQWIEPLVTVGLGLFVGSVAVSLFYPLVTLAMNIRH